MIIALCEALPIIGQIASIAEKFIIAYYRDIDVDLLTINVKPEQINELPKEMFINILSYLPLCDFRASALVSKEWNSHTNLTIARNNAMYERFAMGDKKWKEWFGNGIVKEKERDEDFKSLPNNIFTILNGTCPVFTEKKVRDTHFLFKMPIKINGEPVTIKSIGSLLKGHFQETENGYKYIWSQIVTELGEDAIEKSEWILLLKNLLPGSLKKTYSEQQTLVIDLAKKSQVEYQVPKTIEVIVGAFAEYLRSRKRLLNNGFDYKYTHCQEQVKGHQVIVGDFAPIGLDVHYSQDEGDEDIGVVCLRKF